MGRESKRIKRNFPNHTLEEALIVARRIHKENNHYSLNRLLLAEALEISPNSTNFRDILSSSQKYGLTTGNIRSTEIALTEIAITITDNPDSQKRLTSLKNACLNPPIFKKFYSDYSNLKLPSGELFDAILVSTYNVAAEFIAECKNMIFENGRYAEIIKEIQGDAHVIIHPKQSKIWQEDDYHLESFRQNMFNREPAENVSKDESKPIYIGCGKNRIPLEKLHSILHSFKIPHQVTKSDYKDENPVSEKLENILSKCGSAILIFTKDEKYYDSENNEIWLSTEHIIQELGVCSFLYKDRIVIFKEKGVKLTASFQNISYIEFEIESIESKTAELIKSLIGFGLVKIIPV